MWTLIGESLQSCLTVVCSDQFANPALQECAELFTRIVIIFHIENGKRT